LANLDVAAAEVFVCDRAAAEEETGVEAVVEETSSSDVNGGGGEQWSRDQRGLRVLG
jgi:hypothetical protein